MLFCSFFTFSKVTNAKNIIDININKESYTLILDSGLDAFTCSNENVVKLLKLAAIGLMIVKIIVPVLLIVIGMVSLFKAFIEDDQKAFSKALSGFVLKLVIGVFVFLLPSILSSMINLINGTDEIKSEFEACSKCLLNYCDCPGVSCNRKTSTTPKSKNNNTTEIKIP